MLLFCDSFDHYQTPELSEKYSFVTSTGAIITSPGRTGANCLELENNSSAYVQRNLANQSQLIVGVAFNSSVLPAPRQPVILFSDAGTLQGSLQLNASGGLEYHVTINNVDTIIAYSQNGIIQPNTYNYIEVNVLFSPTGGSVSAQVNGESVFSVTGVNTAPDGNSYANSVTLTSGNEYNASTSLFDDLYICNGTGPYNNSFLGDVAVDALFPAGVGQFTQWTPVGQTLNWECVSQYPPNVNDYVKSAIVQNLDFYTIQQLPTTTMQVVAVQIVASAYKDDSNTRVLGVGFGNGTTYVFSSGSSLTSSYVFYTQPYDIDPITSAGWTVSNVNNGQIGIKVIQ